MKHLRKHPKYQRGKAAASVLFWLLLAASLAALAI